MQDGCRVNLDVIFKYIKYAIIIEHVKKKHTKALL